MDRVRGFVIFAVACFVILIVMGIWIPATHESKGERIDRLEMQVGELQHRVAKLESK